MSALVSANQWQPALRQRTTIMDLPVEIRLKIFRFFVARRDPKVLCPVNEILSSRIDDKRLKIIFPSRPDMALVHTSRTIRQEAADVVFGYHTFHFLTDPGPQGFPDMSTLYLPYMKHISLNLTALRKETTTTVDPESRIYPFVELINASAASLCTLTLHVVPTYPTGEYVDILKGGRTASILKKLHPRLNRLSIIVYGLPRALGAFRNAIARGRDWEHRVYTKWPMICINNSEESNMGSSGDEASGRNESAIRGWHLYKRRGDDVFPKGTPIDELPTQ
ncbi:hypothetical protein ACLMJK_004237 [Lecanora helva]